jgi:hypothetical protein
MKLQQAELKNLIEKHASKEGGSSTAVPCLRFFCATAPSEFLHTLYEPSLCIIAQGSKAVGMGEEMFSYDKDKYLIASVHLPARVQIQDASVEKPYVSLQLTFSMDQILEILKECNDDEVFSTHTAFQLKHLEFGHVQAGAPKQLNTYLCRTKTSLHPSQQLWSLEQ